MRFHSLALVVGMITLGACAGGDKPTDDTTHVAVDTSAAVTPATGGTTPAATGTMAAATGKTHEVKMVGGDAQGYRYEPANITVKQGDAIKFVMVSGGPHNVAFDPAKVPADVRPQLDANMGTEKMGELSSAMKMNAGESITISFANIKAGQYPYHCVPHLAMNMKGVITVQ